MGSSDLKAWFAKRMPNSQQIAAVYGVIVLVVYGWTIYWYLWKLPSWLYFMTLTEMLVAFAYAMAVNFLESVLILLVPILLCLFLPSRWFRDQFVAQGAILVVLILVALMQYLKIITSLQDLPPGIGRMALLVMVGIVFLVFLVGRIGFLGKVIAEIANRATIFLYIFMPISALSLLVVLFRNIVEALNG
jgi:hypothetical protein